MSDYTIIDNWYENPNQVRIEAINLLNKKAEAGKLRSSGAISYPGYRSRTFLSNLLYNKEKIEKKLNLKINPKKWIYSECVDLEEKDFELLEYDFNTNELKLKNSDIIFCYDNFCSNGSFQYCTESCKTWVHADKKNDYAAVVYLQHNPPPRCGTGFYKHKRTQKIYEDYNDIFPLNEVLDFNTWEEIDYVENVYNRCVIYNAKQFHTSTGYFGDNPENSRLFQVFFFSILS